MTSLSLTVVLLLSRCCCAFAFGAMKLWVSVEFSSMLIGCKRANSFAVMKFWVLLVAMLSWLNELVVVVVRLLFG